MNIILGNLISGLFSMMDPSTDSLPKAVGRAAQLNVPNRFEQVRCVDDLEQVSEGDELLAQKRRVPTEFLPDASRTVIRENDSPDVPFRFSVNPYRGCEHGCVYCYARPTHETLGMNAGLDFESKILVKHDGPDLLRDELNRSNWRCEPIAISGVTDCYQPAERQFQITRRFLEVMWEARQPCMIVTKNALITRDLDLLGPMSERNLVTVSLSVTTLDDDLARTMEPRTSTPQARIQAIKELTAAGVPTSVMVAPIIPGLNDAEIPAILQAAGQVGAKGAAYVLLRLPYAVEPLFDHWLTENYPLKRERILGLIRETRGGQLNDPRFGSRMRGEGTYAEQIHSTFSVFIKKFALDGPRQPLDCTQFRPPRSAAGQGWLF